LHRITFPLYPGHLPRKINDCFPGRGRLHKAQGNGMWLVPHNKMYTWILRRE